MGELRKEVLRLNTMEFGRKVSREENNTQKWTKILGDIRREFTNFKQNVLQELERQKRLVDQMIKEVILTL